MYGVICDTWHDGDAQLVRISRTCNHNMYIYGAIFYALRDRDPLLFDIIHQIITSTCMVQ